MLDARDDVIGLFEKGIFSYKDNAFKTKEEESEENKLEKIKDDYKKCIKYIEDESKGINYDLFKDYLDFVVPSALAKKLYEAKDKNKNNELVEKIKSGWSDLKNEIKKMSEYEKQAEKPDKILEIVEEILLFNRENRKQQGLFRFKNTNTRPNV